jgi:hypothetical protein
MSADAYLLGVEEGGARTRAGADRACCMPGEIGKIRNMHQGRSKGDVGGDLPSGWKQERKSPSGRLLCDMPASSYLESSRNQTRDDEVASKIRGAKLASIIWAARTRKGSCGSVRGSLHDPSSLICDSSRRFCFARRSTKKPNKRAKQNPD